MPSLSQVTPAGWAAMRCSTSIAAYQVMDLVREGAVARASLNQHQAAALPDLLEAGWVAEGADGTLTMAEAGRRHLASF